MKNKTNKAFSDMEHGLIIFYSEMRQILTSKRGKKFQFMMLNRTFEALIFRSSQIRDEYNQNGTDSNSLPKSPLDN